MASHRVLWASWSIVCGGIAALEPGCGGDVDHGDPQAAGAGVAQAAVDSCTVSSTPGTWSNQAFPEQAKQFHVEVDVTPSSTSLDAVVGLGDGTASSFSQLAAIVRFNPSGMIDARDGSSYRADTAVSYLAGEPVHVRFDVDLPTHSYSAWVRTSGVYRLIGHWYSFRTEQAAASRLNNVASEVDSSSGTLEVCAPVVVTDATTADGCVAADAADGVVTAALADATVLDSIEFTVRPSAQNMDAVIGLSAGPASGFSDLAAALRLSPAGVLDVRDGDVYRADLSQPYDTSEFDARMIADLTSHTYSVFEGTFAPRELARGYRFRTEQSAVAHLDHLGMIVDGTPGRVEVCWIPGDTGGASSGIAFSREGSYAVMPLADDAALLSDGATTTRVDADGHVLGSVARGGQLATDVLGNIFIASIDGNTLAVDKYDPSFAPRWQATGTVLAGSTVTAMSTDPTGAVLIGVVTPQDGSVTVFRFTAGGAAAAQLNASGHALTIDGDQPIVARNDGSTFHITRFDATGTVVWDRAFTGNAQITAMTFDPGHAVLFGGELLTAIDFGGGTLPLRTVNEAGRINGFVVKLSATGAHVFSMKTGYSEVGGIAANDARVLVSGTEHTQFRYEHLQSFAPDGTPGGGPVFETGLGQDGFGRRVTQAASGRVWWNLETRFPTPSLGAGAWPYLVVIAE
jgi:hypothetical protein